ncbi:MAG: hypothetical protein CMI52_04205 [Parcubacteria group bacterium]|nr:hypothetical protein [Parcubacteria group bacterium]|tara:strand:+ start:1445 stop:1714 length:270 start_codon:yes stop_codon:yes gene_type:complete
MFKGIRINLTGPICTCKKENLDWSINQTKNKINLIIECNTCKTRLFTPHEKFFAVFKLETPYPESEKSSKPERNGILILLKPEQNSPRE